MNSEIKHDIRERDYFLKKSKGIKSSRGMEKLQDSKKPIDKKNQKGEGSIQSKIDRREW